MRKLTRSVLWLAKAGLLVIALAALALWAASRSRAGTIRLWRYVAVPGRVDRFDYRFNWFRGHIFITRFRETRAPTDQGPYKVNMNELHGWAVAAAHHAGPKWHVERWPLPPDNIAWLPRTLYAPHSTLGPLRWKFYRDDLTPGYVMRSSLVAAPCWLIAAAAGAWPTFSLGLFACRAYRSRRRTRAGHCPACDYDLRATPDRCPECGWQR